MQTRRNFDDQVGKDVAEIMLDASPQDWHADAFASALTYQGKEHFPRPDIVYTVDLTSIFLLLCTDRAFWVSPYELAKNRQRILL